MEHLLQLKAINYLSDLSKKKMIFEKIKERIFFFSILNSFILRLHELFLANLINPYNRNIILIHLSSFYLSI